MNVAPLLYLSQERVERLLAYIKTWRQYALSQLPLTVERNNNLRILQHLQGMLINRVDLQVNLSLSPEEVHSLRVMVADVVSITEQEVQSRQKTLTLLGLAELQSALKSAPPG